MKYIKHRRVRDLEILDELEVRQILSSYPLLQLHRPAVVDGYKTYLKAKGAIPASHPVLPKQLCDAMKVHYENKVQSLEFIEDIRTKLSPGVCPMCGSASTSTTDHVMPKDSWPAFSFFSRNLVPACDECNRKKGVKFFGAAPNARPIHPYYDKFLRNRVVTANLIAPFAHPVLEIVMLPGLSPAEVETVEWHLEEVVRKTTVADTLRERWTNICRDPEGYYDYLGAPGATMAQAVERKLRSHDRGFRTPNNWESMLQYGILTNSAAVAYLEHCRANPVPNLD
jgi:5-methylcytosine-specific restriction endonuclease McrA